VSSAQILAIFYSLLSARARLKCFYGMRRCI
jgi:hypothetical protein